MDWKAQDLRAEEFVADNYDQLYDSTRFAHYMYDSFVSEVTPRTGRGPVLELACGTGAVTGRLKKVKPQIITHCMDFSPKMLAIAEKRCDHCLKADLEDLPYENDYFSTVYVHSALHHFQSFDKIMQGVKRILKSDGFFIIQEPNQQMTVTKMMRWLHFAFRKLGIKFYPDLTHLEGNLKPSEHHGKIYAEDIAKALKQNGFEVQIVKQKFFSSAYLRQFNSGFAFKLSKMFDSLTASNTGYMFLIIARKPSN